MGLLDRWSKKKQQEQLEQVVEKKEETKEIPKEEKKAKKEKAESKKDLLVEEKTEEKVIVYATRVLAKPLVTEKAAIMEGLNKYSFIVHRNANKHEIKQAIKEQYGIKPERVNVINMDGKTMRFGRSVGRRSDYRKAVVTLPKGKTISIHKGV